MPLSVFITPALLIGLLIYGTIKKVNCYSAFVKGSAKSLDLCKTLFPFIIAIFVAIQLFNISGLSKICSQLCSPVFSFLGVPAELCELMLIRPFSGSGSLAIYENILSIYGADSYPSRCASVILGSSETVFYVATIYFSKTKVKKLLYAIPIAFLATIASAILSCWLCKIM